MRTETVKIHGQDYQVVWKPDALPGEEPLPGRTRQREFLAADEDFCLMDGGKGSGKSDLLVFGTIASEYISSPRFHAVLFRREYKRLVEIIDRAHYWFKKVNLKAHWQGDHSRFVFPSGAWFAFHNVENLGDEQKYQGWEITRLMFDQLEEFAESQFDYLVMQNRSSDPRIGAHLRMTANPGGKYHSWVKRRFIDGYEPGGKHVIATNSKEQTHEITYRRIFATVFDNPVYRNDAKYIAKLASLSPEMRKAYLEGDWNVVTGQFFWMFSTPAHVIKSSKLPKEWERCGGLDYGNVTSLEVLARDYDGNIYVENEFHSEGEVASVKAERSGRWLLGNYYDGLLIQADTNMWVATGHDIGSDKTPEAIFTETWDRIFEQRGRTAPYLVPVSKASPDQRRYRVVCNEAVKDYLYWESNDDGTVKKPPRLFFLDRCRNIIATLPALVGDDNNIEDIADGQEDHDFDALKYALMELSTPARPEEDGLMEWEREFLARQVQDRRPRGFMLA